MTSPRSRNEDFFVVAREPGQQVPDLPTWADRHAGNMCFERDYGPVSRIGITGVPGAFQIRGLLSGNECEQFVAISEMLGYHDDAPVSLDRSVRHNHNVNWVVDGSIGNLLWSRFGALVTENIGGPALGLNARFRFYRYQPGDYFRPHTDGAWPGSQVVNGELRHDAFGDRISQMTCLLFLSEGYRGGRTLFYLPRAGGETAYRIRAVATPKGHALCFPHGSHPLHCLHAGEAIESGNKYIIRTDILFPLADSAL